MKTYALLWVAVFCASTTMVLKADGISDDSGAYTYQNSDATSEAVDSVPSPMHNQWVILGCVHNVQPQHECEHLAHGYGYTYHTVVHDHFRCPDHDHSYACYGR